ncbi:MAG: PIG-L family deacetylase, partial [Chthoniobacterales bacterium]
MPAASKTINGVIIVAHPDDDALFAGPYQIANPWISWQIVSVTYSAEHPRGRELLAWQSQLQCAKTHFLGLPDSRYDIRNGKSSFTPDDVIARLKPLKLSPQLILTHSPEGEYGHPHHKVVSEAVTKHYPKVKTLTFAHYSKSCYFSVEVPDYYERCIAA